MTRNYFYILGILSILLTSCNKVGGITSVNKPIDLTGNYVMYGGPFTTVQLNSNKSVWVTFGASSSKATLNGYHILFSQGYDTTDMSISLDGKTMNYEHNGEVVSNVGIKVENDILWSAFKSYYNAEFEGASSGFQQYLHSHPEDVFAHICLANCLFQMMKYNEAKTELARIENNSQLQSNPLLKHSSGIVKYCLTGKEKSAIGLNACDGYNDALKLCKVPDNNKEIWRIETHPTPLDSIDCKIIQEYIKENMTSIEKFISLPEKPEYYDSNVSFDLIGRNYIKSQVLSKSAILYGRLLAYDGKIKEPVEVYRRVIRMGQQMMSSPLIYQLIGIAIRRFGIDGMRFLYTDGKINNVSDAQLVLNTLTTLRHSDPISNLDSLTESEPNMWVINLDGYEPALTRSHVAESKLILLETVAAAKLYQLKKGKYPQSTKDLIPTYLPELPVDTFAKNPIILKRNNGTEVLLYSYGPDTTDDHGEISYDPTNGTISRGDLLFP